MKTTKLLLSGVVAMMVAASALASHNGVIYGTQSVPRPKPISIHIPLSLATPR
jgi:hypothetical protein